MCTKLLLHFTLLLFVWKIFNRATSGSSSLPFLLEAKKPQQWTTKIPQAHNALLLKKQNTFPISRAEALESFEC